MCHLAKPKSNTANSLNLYPKTKGYFRETCKFLSQNINFISPTSKFKIGIIHIIIKSLSTILVLSSIKNIQFQYLTFQPDQESDRAMYTVKVFSSLLVYTSFPLI